MSREQKLLIKRLKNPTQPELKAVKKLLVQLTDKKFHQEVFNQSGAEVHVLIDIGQESEPIIGMASIYFVQKMTGWQCFVEDVVVDKKYRGGGLARKLMNHLIDLARARGIKYIDLTSNPERIAAISLYVSLGFKLRAAAAPGGTNLFRLDL